MTERETIGSAFGSPRYNTALRQCFKSRKSTQCVCVGGGGGEGRGGRWRLINPLNAAAARQKGRHRKRSFSHWLAKSAQVAEVASIWLTPQCHIQGT